MRLRASAEKRLAFGADCSMVLARSPALVPPRSGTRDYSQHQPREAVRG